MLGIQKFEVKMQHPPMQHARDRMYRRALKYGEDLSFFDVQKIVKADGYYKKHQIDVQMALALNCEVYQSCGFAIPPEYEIAIEELKAGNGDKFVKIAVEAF